MAEAHPPQAAEVCEFLGVRCPEPLANVVLRRVSSAAQATNDAIVFATDAETLTEAVGSAAGLILCELGVPATQVADDLRTIVIREARTALARVYHRFFAPAPSGVMDVSAMVDPSAQIGAGTSIGAGSVIEAGVVIGSGCRIGPRVTIHSGTTLGDRVQVQAGVVLGSIGFGYVNVSGELLPFPQIGTLRIEDDVDIGANTTIDRGALGETCIGRGSKLDNLVHIAHNCLIGERVLIAAQVGLAGSCVIEDGAMLGGQVGLGERVTIGRGVILGGQGGVLPGKRIDGAGVVYWGTPAQPVREYLRALARMRKP